MSDITVRRATAGDVLAMSTVMTASIAQLCAADHRDQPAAIAAWTANKTPEGVTAMLANPQAQFYVAERDGEVVAVGAINSAGEITLNYVTPQARFSGVSKALLTGLEAALARDGHREGRLKSTTTAKRFYLARGWIEDGPVYTGRFIDGHPMRKRL